jgi:hypothetical protein
MFFAFWQLFILFIIPQEDIKVDKMNYNILQDFNSTYILSILFLNIECLLIKNSH